MYINDKLENTWIRTGDGDRRATKDEIAAFMRNAHPSQDDLVLDNFGIDDLDLDSILAFKERINKRYSKQKYLEMKNEIFLTEIGAGVKDRISGKLFISKTQFVMGGDSRPRNEIIMKMFRLLGVSERHLLQKEGKGKSTRYFLGMGSVEMLTHLQIALEVLRTCI